jgi:archaellum component FlaF (FlaF/FlaG flagellin family)
MGFGTSGSMLLIFAGLFVALGTLYTATSASVERVADATGAQSDRFSEVSRTGVNVTGATWNASGNDDLEIRVKNTGETVLDAGSVDVVVDGEYVGVEAFERAAVDGVPTDVWRPNERLVLEDRDTVTARPDRVKVVTGPGVADTAEVGR